MKAKLITGFLVLGLLGAICAILNENIINDCYACEEPNEPPPPPEGGGHGCKSCEPFCRNRCKCATSGHPIAVKNGEYLHSETDLYIPGRVLPIEITRTYGNQRDYNDSPFGYNWDMSYNLKVSQPNGPSNLYFSNGEGCKYEYTRDPCDPNMYILDTEPGNYFIHDAISGTFTLFKQDQMQLAFDANDNVSSITDENGNRIHFTYDASGLLTKITDDLNRDINLSYDTADKLVNITDFTNRQWDYFYDVNNDLNNVIGPTGLTVTYEYDSNHNLEYVYDDNDRLLVQNHYDGNKVEWQIVGDGNYVWNYNYGPNTVAIWDRQGYRTEMVYGDGGQLISQTVFADDNDPNFTTTYVYDSNIQEIREILPAGNCTDYTYDSLGNTKGIYRKTEPQDPNDSNDPNVIATTYTYDTNFPYKVRTVKNPDGNVTKYEYISNSALEFNGNSDYINMGDPGNGSLDFGASDSFTLSIWFKRASIGSQQSLIFKREVVGGTHYEGYTLRVSETGPDNKLNFGIEDTENRTVAITGTTAITNGNWHHAVAVRNTSTDKIYVYLDGESDATPVTDTTITTLATDFSFWIGKWHTYNLYFDGDIDDVRVYRRALSPSEVESLYITGDANSTGLAGYWKMDDNADNKTVADSSGSGNNGTSVRNTSAMHVPGEGTGNLVKITYPEVNTPSGNKQPVVKFTYNSLGQMATSTDPCGIITAFEYGSDNVNEPNNYGKLIKVIVDSNEADANSLKITTTYEYDELGNVIEVNDPNGNITRYEYNALVQLANITDPCGNITRYSYDENGNRKKIEGEISSEPNQITRFTYNVLNNLMKITDPCNYDTLFGYNKNEEPNIVTDAEDNNTVSVYNERGLLWKVTDANGNVTEYGYDENANLKTIEDANGDITSYDYDGFDRLIKITYPDDDDSNEKFTYDKNSNVTSKKNRKGNTIYYQYDALNRLVVKDLPGEPNNITFTYDIAGRLVDVNDGRAAANGGGTTKYEYDRIGRVKKVTYPGSKSISYLYDKRGLRTKLTYPDSSYIIYEYDVAGRLWRIKDDANAPNVLAEYKYDQLSRRTLLTLGNDTNSVYEYDIADKLTKLTNDFNEPNSMVFEYSSYDKVGNRLAMTDSAGEHEYAYDELYQLVDVNYPESNITYSYDSLGNREAVINGGTTNYSRNILNQYTKVADVNYSYDKNGNLADINNGQFQYIYDCENRLIEAKENSVTVATYVYDFAGRRVSKTAGGITARYVYDGDQIVAEYEGETLVRKFIYGPGIDEPICMQRYAEGGGLGWFYYHFDGLGSVVALSDDDSQIVEIYSYDVFGEPNRTSSIGNPYLFTGRQYDNETGLYYYRARYYSPAIGRFLQTDPIGYEGGLNLYAYVGNNPVNRIDPYGLDGGYFGGLYDQPGECDIIDGYYRHCVSTCRLHRMMPGPLGGLISYGAALYAGGDWPCKNEGVNNKFDRMADLEGLRNAWKFWKSCKRACKESQERMRKRYCKS